jgi:hypothetical protein
MIGISQDSYLFAQGQFSTNGVQTYQGISGDASWFSSSSAVTVGGFVKKKGEELMTGPTPGCACITAASGSILSAPLKVTVGSPSPTPCPPCPLP